jgi:hypothetical protein
MKTFPPVKFRTCLEIMPFEAHACALHAAVQMLPSSADPVPRRALCEGRRVRNLPGAGNGFRAFGGLRHADTLPMFPSPGKYLIQPVTPPMDY